MSAAATPPLTTACAPRVHALEPTLPNEVMINAPPLPLQVGCVVHSVIIGVGMGVLTTNLHLVILLLIVLTLHQVLEAVALASLLALADLGTVRKLAMAAGYAAALPLGIATGIAVSATYAPNTPTAMYVQGVFNSVSGGMVSGS